MRHDCHLVWLTKNQIWISGVNASERKSILLALLVCVIWISLLGIIPPRISVVQSVDDFLNQK